MRLCVVFSCHTSAVFSGKVLGSFLGCEPLMDRGVIFSEGQGCLPSLGEESSLLGKRATRPYVEVAQMLPHLGWGGGRAREGTQG